MLTSYYLCRGLDYRTYVLSFSSFIGNACPDRALAAPAGRYYHDSHGHRPSAHALLFLGEHEVLPSKVHAFDQKASE